MTKNVTNTNQYLIKRLTDDVLELKKELNEVAEMVSYIKKSFENDMKKSKILEENVIIIERQRDALLKEKEARWW
tara:strand:+ start:111 stop:335 length:225 start_codon:yes stop_codon:yes gene_type:complete